ncbi:nucleoplasmin-like isoform X1 [Oncorhynchus tshawytscha]|uniref:nucleoplasmin-like isoform X1 n=1 Tax=Oncorhynchus tshawytscha TaxID=74940 RepID=UPI000D0981ED|nr:nucleoplasmin-like isoform X1 [Oncorhynchus tshawytscha]
MIDAREEMLTLLQKLWAKLQGLPTASPLEMGAFAVLVLFIGCELNDTQRKAVFEIAEDLLEHQFFIRTMCLSADASKEMHVVEVQDRVGECCKPVPIATLHPMCQPMVSFSGFELIPPVTFNLRSGQGPLFISGQHLTLVYEEEEEEEKEEVFSSTPPLDHSVLQ